ncbi:hypothetical protein ACFC8F_08390 [Streptomyces hydrogenans]|uniref:hypothetical protein n=1 Tax=Streptomyces hydrogenans TaxID=1873719 RepID=UPI0035E016AD
MCPTKSSTDGGPRGDGPPETFSKDLKALYEAAGGETLKYPRLIAEGTRHGFTVSKTNLSGWFLGTPPRLPRHVTYVLTVLIPFLEDRAELRSPGHRRVADGVWGRRLAAAQAVGKRAQGGRGPHVGAASAGRVLGGLSPTLRDVLPRDFVGRERECADLAAFTTAPDGSPSYLRYQAGPWAGKTALLAWFLARELPSGVDFAHYFVSGRHGTDRRLGFARAVDRQLASAAGSRHDPALDPDRLDPDKWFGAAARACEKRGRRLVLVVDGLDEDADAGVDRRGIAGLLPKEPPHGMRVIVAGRRNPRVPERLADDHPMRDSGVARRLSDSPAARIIRDAAMAELRGLLKDSDFGERVLGLLVTARGALSREDLGELLDIGPHAVEERLRTAVGRSLASTRTDLLPLDVRSEAEAEDGRQTFVLAHSMLHATAYKEIRKRSRLDRIAELHAWAREYQAEGWDEETPNYLLTGYTRLVREQAHERLAGLVLDPRRQLRLVLRGGADVALGDVESVAPADGEEVAPARAAAVAVSRELLRGRVRALPGSVARTVARLGDAGRARALTGASGRAVEKAVRLADLARALHARGDAEAAATARAAVGWARTALREAGRFAHVVDEAGAAAARAAVALLETALAPDRRDDFREALALLRASRGTGAARYEAWALAARLLAPEHPDEAAELLDGLEEEAEGLAAEGDAAGAVQVWETVAAADPDRGGRVRGRVLAHVTEVWEEGPTLEKVGLVAVAVALAAPSRPEPAARLVDSARQYLESVLGVDAGGLSAADAFPVEFGFRDTLEAFCRALVEIGASEETVDRVRDLGLRVLPPESEEEVLDADPFEDGAFVEAGRVADEALALTDRGADDEAEQELERALALLPAGGLGEGLSPVWAADLAGALVRTGAADEAAALLATVERPADRVRVNAALALACADAGRPGAAYGYAGRATREAAGAGTGWAHAAQAWACVGEAGNVVDLLARHLRQPDRAGTRAAWREADRAVRIAVAAELAALAPEAAGEVLLPVLKRLDAARKAVRSQALLTSVVELVPAATRLPSPARELFDDLMEEARTQAARSGPRSWRPEDVLVVAFLRLGAGDPPGRQMDWLRQELRNRGADHFPTAALAVLHAALGDLAAAEAVAGLPAVPHHRAAALTAVASHLGRVPVRPSPVPGAGGTDSFTRAVQHLALTATPLAAPAPEAALGSLGRVLTTAGWYHALPVLARVAPEAVEAVHEIAAVHLGATARP